MPIPVFDQASRYVAHLNAAVFIAWLLRISLDTFTFRRWLDTRSTPFPGDPDRTNDTVAHVEDLARGHRPWAIIIEFQLSPDSEMQGRALVYQGSVWLTLKPDRERGSRFAVATIVVNLTGRSTTAHPEEWTEAGLRSVPAVIDRNLCDEDANELLTEIETGQRGRTLLPWIPLMTGADDRGMIERWKRVAAAEPDDRLRSDYGALALVFAEAAGRHEVWAEALKGWNVKQSQQVLQWQADARQEGEKAGRIEGEKAGRIEGEKAGRIEGEKAGRIEGEKAGRRAMLLDLLQTKYPNLPNEVVVAVQQATDLELLARWFKAACVAGNLDEFRKQAQLN